MPNKSPPRYIAIEGPIGVGKTSLSKRLAGSFNYQLFAKENLDPDEYTLSLNVFKHLTVDAPVPSLVIYLQAPTDVLLDRIQKRGIPSEQLIERIYLENLNSAYTEFFHYYDRTPLLIINTSEINLVTDNEDYERLVRYIASNPAGTNFFNPSLSLI